MRIRSIKPEFWISESVGRLSRDARLLFVGLWSCADDSGSLRGGLPYLSGALFPYDSDAQKNIERWICEIEKEGMIRRYSVEGNSFIDIPKWHTHQKIEKPSKSKFPQFPDSYPTPTRLLPDISPLEQGTGNREQGTGNREQGTGRGTGTRRETSADADPLVLEWNESGLPKIVKMTKTRIRDLATRRRDQWWVENASDGIKKAAASPFCLGASERGWTATFDWFLKTDSLARIMEGKYDRSEKATNGHHPSTAAERKLASGTIPLTHAVPSFDPSEEP